MRLHEIIASLCMYRYIKFSLAFGPTVKIESKNVCHIAEGIPYQDKIYFSGQGGTVTIYMHKL